MEHDSLTNSVEIENGYELFISSRTGTLTIPEIINRAGGKATDRFIEFFTANIRNRNTRIAYATALRDFFNWCDDRGLVLEEIRPVMVAAYIEAHKGAKPTIKQHLAAIRIFFDYLVTGQVLPTNPASSVRGPKYNVKRGKTPVLKAEQARELLDSIDTNTLIGLRDRAIIGVMVYTFARVSAVIEMKVEDYYQDGKRYWFRLHEKGGKEHQVPAHHLAEQYVDEYLAASGIIHQKKGPLFRSINKYGNPSDRAVSRTDVLRMIKRRAEAIGLPSTTCCHTFRATGITSYLENGGIIEKAQVIANHESPRTTKLYDRTNDEISLAEIERIHI
jgi:integrase/recombinase XerD